MEVRMDLAQIVISETREQQLIVLRERNGQRTLPIVIGLTEALARKEALCQIVRMDRSDPLSNALEARWSTSVKDSGMGRG